MLIRPCSKNLTCVTCGGPGDALSSSPMNVIRLMKSIVMLSGLPRPLQIGIYSLVGIAVGMALLLTRIANGTSYLSDKPETCINCHVMTDAYASWQRGSHGRVAVCVDCHVPHSNIVAKYAFKSRDGMKHSYVFTMRTEPQVLELSPGAVPVVQVNCVRCHGEQLAMIRLAGATERRCWDCHSNIHGEVRSLSASPETLRPGLPSAGLEWMKKGDAK
jgi:cytochrome c nitrite reductase small subunit